MRRSIGKVINSILAPAGYRVERIRRKKLPVGQNQVSQQAALARVVQRGLEINTIIDVGASNGQWTRQVHPFFPAARSLMVEANPVHADSLRKFKAEVSYANYVMAAAGDTTGEIFFDAGDPLGGLASHTPLAVPTITVPVTTIDALVQEHGLPPPYLIKLDTHGFEVPILRGAEEALRQTNLLFIETYNFRLNPTSLKYYELCELLSTWGFSTIDFCAPLWRSLDESFWQFDLLFIPDDRPEFRSNSYA
jgi:FkbM family methyltransferase